MDWIKTCDGYVRADAIIDIHINQTYPGAVYVILISGDSVKYRDFGGDRINAEIAMDKLMNCLTEQSVNLK